MTRRLLVALAASVMVGCGGGPPAPVAATQPALPSTLSIQRPGDTGLEVITFAFTADEASLARAMAAYDGASGLDPFERERWRRAGLMVTSVPAESLEPLRDALTPDRSLRHRWLDDPSRWAPVIVGPRAPTTIDDGEGPAALGAGRLRLLARGWIEPVTSAGAAPTLSSRMRIEAVPQHRSGPDPIETLGLDPAVAVGSSVLEQGVIFRALALRATVDRDRALVIVPADPDADWRDLAEAPPGENTAGSDGDRPLGPPPVPVPGADAGGGAEVPPDGQIAGPPADRRIARPFDAGPAGPAPLRGTPVGLAMLSADHADALAGDAPRVAVIMLPHLRERFTLGPIAASRASPAAGR